MGSEKVFREKEVDAALLADVMHLAYSTNEQQRSTIVLISGDADMRPALEGIRGSGMSRYTCGVKGFLTDSKNLPKNVAMCNAYTSMTTYNKTHTPLGAYVGQKTNYSIYAHVVLLLSNGACLDLTICAFYIRCLMWLSPCSKDCRLRGSGSMTIMLYTACQNATVLTSHRAPGPLVGHVP